MNRKLFFQRLLFGIFLLIGLWITTQYSYLLFHSLAEIFSIVMAYSIFIFAWNSRQLTKNTFLLFIGTAYLYVGSIDLIHTLAYKGMGVLLTDGTNISIQLWIAARYIESVSLLMAPFLVGRKLKLSFIFFVYTLVTTVLLGLIFYWQIFPVCFVEGTGLTTFKKVSEYIISLLLIGSGLVLFNKRDEFTPVIFRFMIWAIVMTIFAEFSFTLYIDTYGLSNLIGHYFKIVSFYLIYKAIIETGLKSPYTLLLKDLKKSEDSLIHANDNLEYLVEIRTTELTQINETLQKEISHRNQVEANLENHRKHLEMLVKERTAELEDGNTQIRKSQLAMRYLLEDINEARISLQTSNERLERANREMESFSYSVCHDLRSPLRAILGFSFKLEGRIGKTADKETLRLMSVISENSIKMQALIGDLFNFSRIGRTELKIERINMQSIVLGICNNFTENTEGSVPEFDIMTLPDASASYPMIKQVLINLLDNAVKFTRTVKSPLITIGSQISEAGTAYYVKDNGSGFDMKFSNKIFDIFMRLHNNSSIEGTGVGLAIVKQIIERHGGSVWVESEPGIGTAFYFKIDDKSED